MPFKIFRDGGQWSVYECAPGYGGYNSRDRAEQEVRNLQLGEVHAAEQDLEVARIRLVRAKAAFEADIRVDMLPAKTPSLTGSTEHG